MATEILAVQESDLEDVIKVIRAGLIAHQAIKLRVRRALAAWCDDETEYLEELKRG